MKTKESKCVILLLLMLIQCGCQNSRNIKDMEDNIADFTSKIQQIESKVIDLTSPTDLLRISEFQDLSSRIEEYLSSVTGFLSDRRNSSTQKMIVVYSLNNLDLETYLDLFESSIELYRKKLIDISILEVFMVPGCWWNNFIIKEYRLLRIRQLLKRNRKFFPENTRAVIDNILQGYLWSTIEDTREIGAPKWLEDRKIKY